MPSSISDIGIIINQKRFGEADKFVRILTRNHGLIDTVAKGARRLISKKSSHLDDLNLIKFQTNRGKEPQYLSQVETIDNFKLIKNNLKKIRTCFYLTEILNQTLPLYQPDEELFVRFKNFLVALDQAEDSDRELAVEFQEFLINRLGFSPPPNNHPQTLVNYFESLIDRPLVSHQITIG